MLPGFFSAPMRSMLLVECMEGPLHKLARLLSSEFSLRTISRLRGELLCFVQSSNSSIAAIGSSWNAPQANHASPSVAWISMIFLTAFFKMTRQRSFFSSNASILNIGVNFFRILLDSYVPHPCRETKIGHTLFPVEERAWPYIIKSCRRSEKSPLKTPALRHFQIRGHRLDWPTLRFVRHEDCRFRMQLDYRVLIIKYAKRVLAGHDGGPWPAR